jgi:hypothetical protein
MSRPILAVVLVASCVALSQLLSAAGATEEQRTDESSRPIASEAGDPPAPPTLAERDELFRKLVTNVRLSGHFTIVGGDLKNLRREEYVITGATKLGNGDLWALTSRIKYGDVDLIVPVPVQVRWAGDTPVIALDRVAIPALGTFSARVVLDEGRYAGTWSHDEKGGHLFGVVERLPEDSAKKEPATTK